PRLVAPAAPAAVGLAADSRCIGAGAASRRGWRPFVCVETRRRSPRAGQTRMVEPNRAPPGASSFWVERPTPVGGNPAVRTHFAQKTCYNPPSHTLKTCDVVAARRLVGAGAGDEARSMRRSLTLTGLLFLFVFG